MKKSILTCICSCLLICLLGAGSGYAADTPPDMPPVSFSRMIDVPGVGAYHYYAQNDPLWSKAIYEPFDSDTWRTMQETGCGPTAAAIALSRQVAPDDLPTLLQFKNIYQDGFYFCPCSVNGYRCDRTHEKRSAETAEDFQTYFPVIIAAYAAGNNLGRTKYRSPSDGTSLDLFRGLARAYNLHYKSTSDWNEAFAALQDGYSIITSVSRGIFTPVSHFLVIAHADEEYVYVLDPYMRQDYAAYDRKGILEVIEPGLVRASMNDWNKLGFSGYYMIRKPIPFGKNTTDVPE